MDRDRLIREVLEEVLMRLREDSQSPGSRQNSDRGQLPGSRQERRLPTAAILGELSREERLLLEGAYRIAGSWEEDWEVLILARISPELLADLALGTASDSEGRQVLLALLGGKRVYLLESGLEYRRYKDRAPKTLYLQYQKYEERLLRFGAELLHQISDLSSAGDSVQEEMACADLTGLGLLRESDLVRARSQGFRRVCIGARTIITPLAGDYISNHSLHVSRRDEVCTWKSEP